MRAPGKYGSCGDYLEFYDGECSCAYPDCGGYSVHEPHCGLVPVGKYGDEIDGAILWDFSSIDVPPGYEVLKSQWDGRNDWPY